MGTPLSADADISPFREKSNSKEESDKCNFSDSSVHLQLSVLFKRTFDRIGNSGFKTVFLKSENALDGCSAR